LDCEESRSNHSLSSCGKGRVVAISKLTEDRSIKPIHAAICGSGKGDGIGIGSQPYPNDVVCWQGRDNWGNEVYTRDVLVLVYDKGVVDLNSSSVGIENGRLKERTLVRKSIFWESVSPLKESNTCVLRVESLS
jgi:hypothetical protein